MTWDANRIWTAVDKTYAQIKQYLAGHEPIRIDPEEEINVRDLASRKAAYSHLMWMLDEIKSLAAKDEIEKSQRWLGFVQGASWILGLAKLSDLRAANRREESLPLKVDDYVQCLGEAQQVFRIAKISEGVEQGTGIAFLCTYKGDLHGWEDFRKLRLLQNVKKIEAWKVRQNAYELRKYADSVWERNKSRSSELHREASLLEEKAIRLEAET
jgi:hypothetical protein